MKKISRMGLALLILLFINGCGGTKQVITEPILPSPSNEEVVLATSPSPDPTTTIEPIPQPNIRTYLSGWYATYDKRGLTSFINNISLFNEINPVWYNLEANGSLKFTDSITNKNKLLTQARNNKIKILPTVQNFGGQGVDTSAIRTILKNQTLRTNHVTTLVNLVLENNYDGIEIDYEGLTAVDKNYFTLFIKELNVALKKHQRLLSVALYAKTSNLNTWAGPGAQDWTALAPEVDTIKIMAYDYHWSSFHAGPISPIDWLEAILNYSRTVPAVKGKLIIGLPFYGLDWYGAQAREAMYADISPERKVSATRTSIQHVSDYCKWYSKNIEPHYQYNNNGQIRTVYYQDRQALAERMKLISRYLDTVKGVTFWHLGGEDPGSWSIIRSYK